MPPQLRQAWQVEVRQLAACPLWHRIELAAVQAPDGLAVPLLSSTLIVVWVGVGVGWVECMFLKKKGSHQPAKNIQCGCCSSNRLSCSHQPAHLEVGAVGQLFPDPLFPFGHTCRVGAAAAVQQSSKRTVCADGRTDLLARTHLTVWVDG